jgi:hypothetical protein
MGHDLLKCSFWNRNGPARPSAAGPGSRPPGHSREGACAAGAVGHGRRGDLNRCRRKRCGQLVCRPGLGRELGSQASEARSNSDALSADSESDSEEAVEAVAAAVGSSGQQESGPAVSEQRVPWESDNILRGLG